MNLEIVDLFTKFPMDMILLKQEIKYACEDRNLLKAVA